MADALADQNGKSVQPKAARFADLNVLDNEVRRSSWRPRASRLLNEDRWKTTVGKLAKSGAPKDGLDGLSVLAAQCETLIIEMCQASSFACVDMQDLAKIFREELLCPQAIAAFTVRRQRRNTRSHSAYVYKHVLGEPSQDYDCSTKLGSGAFGVVLKAVQNRTGKAFAIKQMERAKINQDELWTEVETMKELDHPHIMRLFQSFETPEHIYLVMELCSGGGFNDMLEKAGYLLEYPASRIFKQIIGVVSYLHANKICHRDLKPENFLVRKAAGVNQLHLKLSDFGTAKRFDLNPLVTKVCTPLYVAPEVLRTKPPLEYSEKVDVWACGIILYQMICGQVPFSGSNDLELLKKVRRGMFEFLPVERWQQVSEPVLELVNAMICKDAQQRSTAVQAFNSPWVQHQKVCEEDRVNNKLLEQIRKFLTCNRLKRVALRIIAQQIGDESVDRLRNIFLEMDIDNTGTLNRYKMMEAVRVLEVNDMVGSGMVELMCQLDPTGQGNVEYTEFLAATMTPDQYMVEETVKMAFTHLDSDMDGVITRKDLGVLIDSNDGIRDAGLWGTSLGEMINELERIMTSDEDGNGGIDFEEFMRLMADEGEASKSESAVEKRRKRGRKSYKSKDFASLDVLGADADEIRSVGGSTESSTGSDV